MNIRDQVITAITSFAWDNFGLDLVEDADPQYAAALADAVMAVMDNPAGHVVDITPDGGWLMKHPLTCRPDLAACPYNYRVDAETWRRTPGRYLVVLDDDGHLHWIGEAPADPSTPAGPGLPVSGMPPVMARKPPTEPEGPTVAPS